MVGDYCGYAMRHRCHRIRLYPTKEQEEKIKQSCGVARFSYNWGLQRWSERVANGEKPNVYQIRKELNAIKREQFPWMLDVTKCAPMEALLNLGKAFDAFFKKKSRWPKYKKKGACRDSFSIGLEGGNFTLDGTSLKIPKITKIRMAEPVRFNGRATFITILRVADRWYAVVRVELQDQSTTINENQVGCVGIDLGFTTFATLSTGEKVEHPRYLRNSLGRIKRCNRELRRKLKGSKNEIKARIRLGRCYARVANQRNSFLHKLTTEISRKFDTVVIENLNVSGLAKTMQFGQSINDSGFSNFRRMLSYKVKNLVVADRFFPSSKICSSCGLKNKTLKLSERHWICVWCPTRS